MIILVNYKRKNWFQKLFSNKDNETYIVYYRKDNTNEVEIHSEFPTYMKNFYKLDGEFYYNKQLKVLINKNTSEKFSTWDLVKNSESLDFNIENLSWYIYERYYGTNTVISFIPYIITKIDKNIIYRNKEIYEMFEYLYYNILDELPKNSIKRLNNRQNDTIIELPVERVYDYFTGEISKLPEEDLKDLISKIEFTGEFSEEINKKYEEIKKQKSNYIDDENILSEPYIKIIEY